MRGVLFTLAAVLSLSTVSAFAGSASADMRVSVQVVARANVTITSQPAEVTVTDADVARGFVDVSEPLVVRAQTNSRRGYLLQVSNTGAAFASMQLRFGDTAMNVAAEGWVSRPYVSGGEIVSVFARLHLAPGSAAGRYALPVAISAMPL